jgi:hypothetical protein
MMQINPKAAPVVQSQQPKQPPAQVARDAIAAQPDLGTQSFGQLVSRIARGESISSPE